MDPSPRGLKDKSSRLIPPDERADAAPPRHAAFDAKVEAVDRASQGRYGSRRVQHELNEAGVRCSRDRVAHVMRRRNLQARGRRRFKATTDSKHTVEVAPNLLERGFTAEQLNRAWGGDITYVPTCEGWLYLAVLIDLHSRRVVGWATSQNIDRRLVLGALRMALGASRPTAGLIHHTDRGSQYASDDYRNALADAGLVCSMSRKGDCWDNHRCLTPQRSCPFFLRHSSSHDEEDGGHAA